MSGILSLLGNEKMQNLIMGTITKKFKEQGIKKIVVSLNTDEKGKDTFDVSPAKENDILVDKFKLEYLEKFFNENKHLITNKS